MHNQLSERPAKATDKGCKEQTAEAQRIEFGELVGEQAEAKRNRNNDRHNGPRLRMDGFGNIVTVRSNS